MASKAINLVVVTAPGHQATGGHRFVVVGCKSSQPDDPSYINDFATFEEAVADYLQQTYPILSLEYWPPAD